MNEHEILAFMLIISLAPHHRMAQLLQLASCEKETSHLRRRSDTKGEGIDCNTKVELLVSLKLMCQANAGLLLAET